MFKDNYYCNSSFWANLDVFVSHVSSSDSNLGYFLYILPSLSAVLKRSIKVQE